MMQLQKYVGLAPWAVFISLLVNHWYCLLQIFLRSTSLL